jgi:pimeloyl-CoA synthetase
MISEVSNSAMSSTQAANQNSNEQMKQKAQSMGVPDEVIAQGRNEVKAWLEANGKQPSEMKDTEGKSGQSLSQDEFQKKAQSMGVPDNIIKQGREAVKEWVMENKLQTTSDDNLAENQSSLPKEKNNKSDSAVNIFV